MTELHWDQTSGVLTFRLSEIEGRIVADGRSQGVADLVHRPTGAPVGNPLICPYPLLAPYRILCRNGWMGELRDSAHEASLIDGGVRIVWRARLAHQAEVVMDVLPKEPNAIDLDIEVTGHAEYEAYELLLSNYFAPEFASGAYVKGARGQVEQIRPVSNPVFRGMYVAFPRDERSANVMSDGRWQRGRHWTLFLAARYYGCPMGFYAHKEAPVDALVMGLPDDVFGVSMAYADEPHPDGVAQHHSLYLHLFGRTIHPGETRRTRVRLAVGTYGGEADRHFDVYTDFLAEANALERCPPVPFDRLSGLG